MNDLIVDTVAHHAAHGKRVLQALKLRVVSHYLSHKASQAMVLEVRRWHSLAMRRYFLIAAYLLMAHTTHAATDTIAPQNPPPPAELSPPVVVEAPEPRYVAPTLRDRIGRIWAPVFINGKGPYRLVLDTGANSSAVINSVTQSLGIPLDPSQKIRLHGVTGTAIVPAIKVSSLEVGDLFIDGAMLPVVADVFGGAEGVLGTKGLGDKRIFIDFGHDVIRISQSNGEASLAGFSRLPIKLTRGKLLEFEIQIGGIRTKAILDTGAQQTIGNASLRNALLRRERDGKDQSIVGVTLDVEHGRNIPIPPIVIGGVEIRNMRVTFGDMFIFDKWDMENSPAMLIGMDVIGSLDALVIDYKLHELLLRTRH